MKKKRFTEEQIIRALKEGEAGEKVADICRKYGISDGTYYNWKAKYGGMTISDAKTTQPHQPNHTSNIRAGRGQCKDCSGAVTLETPLHYLRCRELVHFVAHSSSLAIRLQPEIEMPQAE